MSIANNTIKRTRSRPMEMRYFWVADQVHLKLFDVQWHPGLENLVDYPSKHHAVTHHTSVRPVNLHCKNSPLDMPRAPTPSSLQGCVENIPKGYLQTSPVAFVPAARHLGLARARPKPAGATRACHVSVMRLAAAMCDPLCASIS